MNSTFSYQNDNMGHPYSREPGWVGRKLIDLAEML